MKLLRRTMAGLLAAAGLCLVLGRGEWTGTEGDLLRRSLLGESALLGGWLAASDRPAPEPSEPPAEEAPPSVTPAPEPTAAPAPVPGNIRERSITGGPGYLTGGGVSVFNRTDKTVDLEAAAQGGTSLTFAPADRGPQILIMHTHTTESYAKPPDAPYAETGEAHTMDTGYNITRVGEAMTQVLTEMGFSVLHDTQVYDYPSYNGAYERSRAGVEALLAQYPTIQMVLDVHRDALVDGAGTVYKPVATADGTKVAQVMVLVGTDGAGASFPDWTEHLYLAMAVTREMDALWPGLARPITLRTARFNQQLTKGSLLVEVGSHGNTLEEAVAGGRLFARALGRVLEGYVAAS